MGHLSREAAAGYRTLCFTTVYATFFQSHSLVNTSESLLGIGLSVPFSKPLNLPSIIIHSLKTSHYLNAAHSKKALNGLQGANLRKGGHVSVEWKLSHDQGWFCHKWSEPGSPLRLWRLFFHERPWKVWYVMNWVWWINLIDFYTL